mgnify:FL=1
MFEIFNSNLECRIKSSSKPTIRKTLPLWGCRAQKKCFHVRFQHPQWNWNNLKCRLILKLMFLLNKLIKFSFRDTIFHFQILIHKISIFLCDWNVSWIIDEISVARASSNCRNSHWNGKLWMFFILKMTWKYFNWHFSDDKTLFWLKNCDLEVKCMQEFENY